MRLRRAAPTHGRIRSTTTPPLARGCPTWQPWTRGQPRPARPTIPTDRTAGHVQPIRPGRPTPPDRFWTVERRQLRRGVQHALAGCAGAHRR
eukprot:8584789-Alexandrium_andersonii.AAC.1